MTAHAKLVAGKNLYRKIDGKRRPAVGPAVTSVIWATTGQTRKTTTTIRRTRRLLIAGAIAVGGRRQSSDRQESRSRTPARDANPGPPDQTATLATNDGSHRIRDSWPDQIAGGLLSQTGAPRARSRQRSRPASGGARDHLPHPAHLPPEQTGNFRPPTDMGCAAIAPATHSSAQLAPTPENSSNQHTVKHSRLASAHVFIKNRRGQSSRACKLPYRQRRTNLVQRRIRYPRARNSHQIGQHHPGRA